MQIGTGTIDNDDITAVQVQTGRQHTSLDMRREIYGQLHECQLESFA